MSVSKPQELYMPYQHSEGDIFVLAENSSGLLLHHTTNNQLALGLRNMDVAEELFHIIPVRLCKLTGLVHSAINIDITLGRLPGSAFERWQRKSRFLLRLYGSRQ